MSLTPDNLVLADNRADGFALLAPDGQRFACVYTDGGTRIRPYPVGCFTVHAPASTLLGYSVTLREAKSLIREYLAGCLILPPQPVADRGLARLRPTVVLLKALPREAGQDPFVFTGGRVGKPLSNIGMLKLFGAHGAPRI